MKRGERFHQRKAKPSADLRAHIGVRGLLERLREALQIDSAMPMPVSVTSSTAAAILPQANLRLPARRREL